MVKVGAGLAGVVLVLSAWGVWRLRNVADDLDAAGDLFQRVERSIEDGRLRSAQQQLARAERHLADANEAVYATVPFDLVGWIPGLHQNVTSLRRSVGLAYTMVTGGAQALRLAAPLQDPAGNLEVPLHHGGLPLDVLEAVRDQLRSLAQALPTAGQQPSRALLATPVADLQHEVFTEAVRRRAQFRSLSEGFSLLVDMAGGNGPRRYLIAVANTAEERGAGGMVLSYGELEAAEGNFELSRFGSIYELPLARPAPVELPADYRRRWDGFPVAQYWQQATLGADFPTVAPALAGMYQAATGRPVDGVIQIDPSGLAAILEAVGPVQVDGLAPVSADNVVDFTLNRAYFELPSETRRHVLGDVAEAAFTKLLDGDVPSLRPLGAALSRAVAGRHVMMWTPHGEARSHVRYFGAAGALPSPDAPAYSLVVANLGGNKLDYYLRTGLGLAGVVDTDRGGTVTARITLENAAPPDGTLRYVFGPNFPGEAQGRYHGLVSLYVPAGTALLAVGGGPTATPPSVASEGGHEVVGFEVDVPAGTTTVVELRLGIPSGEWPRRLTVVPQPRVVPTRAAVDVTVDGTRLQERFVADRTRTVVPTAGAG